MVNFRTYNIVTCRGVIVTNITGSRWLIGFTGISVTISLNYNYYSVIADLQNVQFTVTHALRFSVFTSRLLETELKQSHCD
jgi:hypothetical protein